MPILFVNLIFIYLLHFQPEITLKSHKIENRIECDDLRNYGDTKICFPSVKNYIEGSSNQKLKERAEKEVKSFGSDYNLLGFYLPANELEAFKQNPSESHIPEMVKVYALNQLMNKSLPSDFFELLEKKLKGESEIVPWDDLNKKIINYNSDLSFSKPTLIEIYQQNPQFKSVVYFSIYSTNEKFQKILWVVNFCNIKRRLIYVSYAMNYKNIESLNDLKNKNIKFMESFLNLN